MCCVKVERCGSILEMMRLNRLLSEIKIACEDERCILGISDDSRRVQRDWLFICRRGGTPYVQEAIEKGAVVLWEEPKAQGCYHVDVVEEALPILLNAYYHEPCKHLCVIGVTGTNGKTSVSMILKQMIEGIGKQVMVIGTGHVRYQHKDELIENTTPSQCLLAWYFAQAKELHIPYIVMEVSSHAIDQGRIDFIRYDFILYTNIRKDHMDYHLTRTHYTYTKFKLRKFLKAHGVIIVNHDDTQLHYLYDLSDRKIITIGSSQAHLCIEDIVLAIDHSEFTLLGQHFETGLLGMMNLYNIVEVLAVLHYIFVPVKKQVELVKQLKGIAGRMEVLEVKDYYIWIDYAHTASALLELLKLANQVKQSRVICVIGCGGNRDCEKRPQMANIASEQSDACIFTADNPRNEAIQNILMEMIQGVQGEYHIYENRAYAIKYAMKIAQKHDIIVIAGKGDEEYQLIKGRKYPFSDREWVRIYSRMEE